MARVCDVVDVMESIAPSHLAESWDTVGLLTGHQEQPIDTVILTLDVTTKTLELATASSPAMIVSHHPLFFKPLKSLAGTDASTEIIRESIKKDIPIFASHTNLDRSVHGVSHALAHKLGLSHTEVLAPGGNPLSKFITYAPGHCIDAIRQAAGTAGAGIIGEYSFCSFNWQGTGAYTPSSSASPYEGTAGQLSRVPEERIEMVAPSSCIPRVVASVRAVHPYEEMAYDIIPLSQNDELFGYGVVGTLEEPLERQDFLRHISTVLETDSLVISRRNRHFIKKVAVAGGSGKDFVVAAVASGADAFVTGELGHHQFLDYGDSILLVDATHRATELPVIATIQSHLEKSLPTKHLNFIIDRGEQIQETIFHSLKK